MKDDKMSSEIGEPDWGLVEEFFYHINERHRITMRRWEGKPPPWTQDRVLRDWFFTNVKREYDKTTIFMKNIYDQHRDAPEDQILLNCGINRYFGHMGFVQEIGWQTKWNPDFLIQTARNRKARGEKNFTGAFVITNNGIKAPKEEVVVNHFLEEYQKAIPELLETIGMNRSWKEAIERLNKVYGFSDFMSKEVILDAMMTPVLENAVDRLTWSPAGPGAKIGAHMIWHLGEVGYNEVRNAKGNYLPYMEYLLTRRNDYLEDHTIGLEWGLHDIQWNLCEFQKRINIKNKGKGKRRYRG